uniref:Uncharacterized protein n=1 Tax=Romanomermis culicivorax TaxID=13658 RepID=A0A915K8S6_ROMCU
MTWLNLFDLNFCIYDEFFSMSCFLPSSKIGHCYELEIFQCDSAMTDAFLSRLSCMLDEFEPEMIRRGFDKCSEIGTHSFPLCCMNVIGDRKFNAATFFIILQGFPIIEGTKMKERNL